MTKDNNKLVAEYLRGYMVTAFEEAEAVTPLPREGDPCPGPNHSHDAAVLGHRCAYSCIFTATSDYITDSLFQPVRPTDAAPLLG
jgi:hypothetical protein